MKNPPRASPPAPPAATGPTDPEGAEKIGVTLHAAESILSLRVVGTEHELRLPPKNVFVLGTGDVDVRVPVLGAARMVSRRHAELTRQGSGDGTWLQVVDLGSTHGTYFKKGRERDFPVRAGERFRVANTELLVMDRSLTHLRETLGGFFGFGQHPLLDDHLALLRDNDLGQNEPLILLGDVGSERGHLAQALHRYSGRRSLPFRVLANPAADRNGLVPEFQAAAHGTLFVSLDNRGSRTPLAPLIKLLFDRTYDVRPIIAARTLPQVCGALNVASTRFKSLTVPPVCERRDDIPALFDMLLAEEGSPHRVTELPTDRLAAMCAFDWPQNRADLRATARRLSGLLAHPTSLTAAAKAVGMNDDSFRVGLARVGAIVVQRRE